MTGLVRKAAVLAVCGVFFGAAVAFAGVPSPGNSSIPLRINLVGFDIGSGLAGGGASGATVSVTVRDLANNPIPNSSVVLDFSGCTSDTRIDDTQAYDVVLAEEFSRIGDPSATATHMSVICGTKSVLALTDGAGVATFAVVGGGYGVAGAAHAAGAGKVWADGVLLGNTGVGQYDQNGVGGVGGADLSRWLADFVAGTNPDRSDFNGVGGVGGADLSLWLAVFVAGASNSSSASYCL
jgi:hypothetical protein